MIEHIAQMMGCSDDRAKDLNDNLRKHGLRKRSGYDRYTRLDALRLALAHAFSPKVELAGPVVVDVISAYSENEDRTFEESTLDLLSKRSRIEIRLHEVLRRVQRIHEDGDGHYTHEWFSMLDPYPGEKEPPVEVIRVLSADCVQWIAKSPLHGELGGIKLHHAIRDGQTPEVIADMIGNGADIHCEDDSGCDALHVAVASRRSDLIDVLVKAGANPNTLLDRKPPIVYAAEMMDIDLVVALAKAGADLTLKDRNGNSALCVAKRAGKISAKGIEFANRLDAFRYRSETQV